MSWQPTFSQANTSKVALVTGANQGLGFYSALGLAKAGFKVILACRNEQRALSAISQIQQLVPDSKLDFLPLELSSFKQIKHSVQLLCSQQQRLDLLVNNAGFMMPPYQLTEDGFECQLAVNYLGHFLLNRELFPLLTETALQQEVRIITVASLAHRYSAIRFDDPNFSWNYRAQEAYGQSKMAGLIYAYELARRLQQSGLNIKSVPTHPGVTATEIARHLPPFLRWLAPRLLQGPDMGALPILYACTDSKAQNGQYIGPDSRKEWSGYPKVVDSNNYSKDPLIGKKLWTASEEWTGVAFEV